MASFKKLNSEIYKKKNAILTQDDLYWKKFGAPVLVKEYGPIDYIDFSPVEPYYFAVTCSVRVQVYNPITKLVVKNLSRFRENAYGATFRYDGKLLCAGGEEANVKLFDVSSKGLLRLFKGHTAPVHRTFFLHDKPQIVSLSDDKTVKLWDIPTEKEISSYSEHNDYIRAGAICSSIPDIILSGGYDSMIKMYDTRSNKLVLSVNHGSPIESLLYLPSGGIFLSAGGTDIKIWDSIAGGKLLGCISQHHKTVTCLRLASDNRRLLSGSLDRHVKVYDINTFQVVYTMDYPNAILSLGVSKGDDSVVAGLVDGLVCVSRKKEQQVTKREEKLASYKYLAHSYTNAVDVVVPENVKQEQSKIDTCFRKFCYSKALDKALLPYVAKKYPQKTVAVMQELIRRRALERTLKGRDTKFILQILRFIRTNITNYRFTVVLIDVFNAFLDVYEDSVQLLPSEVKTALQSVNLVLHKEAELGNQLTALHGSISMLLAGATMSSKPTNVSPHNLTPSTDAQKSFIVNLT
uniref:U3 small nucleolar RNA-associated protein 15 homolog n=1 Tax=Photinus pyralis TaxID=7054 RepID=A0A1Y1N2Q3_PHOPY